MYMYFFLKKAQYWFLKTVTYRNFYSKALVSPLKGSSDFLNYVNGLALSSDAFV